MAMKVRPLHDRILVERLEEGEVKKGGIIMAIQAQVPIVPVGIQGGRAAMRKGSAIVRPTVVSVRVGDPIPTAGRSIDDRDAVSDAVRAAVQKLLAEGPITTGV